MRIVIIILISVLMVGLQTVGFAEEDLFDTSAAAEHREKGISLLKAKKFEAAAGELEEAVSIAPDAEAYYYLGYTYYLQGRAGDKESRKKSIECFDKAYELDNNFTPSSFKNMPVPAPNLEQRSKSQLRSAVETSSEAVPQASEFSGPTTSSE